MFTHVSEMNQQKNRAKKKFNTFLISSSSMTFCSPTSTHSNDADTMRRKIHKSFVKKIKQHQPGEDCSRCCECHSRIYIFFRWDKNEIKTCSQGWEFNSRWSRRSFLDIAREKHMRNVVRFVWFWFSSRRREWEKCSKFERVRQPSREWLSLI